MFVCRLFDTQQVNYVVVKCFFERADQEVLNDMAQVGSSGQLDGLGG